MPTTRYWTTPNDDLPLVLVEHGGAVYVARVVVDPRTGRQDTVHLTAHYEELPRDASDAVLASWVRGEGDAEYVGMMTEREMHEDYERAREAGPADATSPAPPTAMRGRR